ncbi:helix-turn-helix domain-containing protein [Verrucosispora sp. WMMD1129]|uniref:helix-turn-helix domain-containing protein n=1 Tax=Verrucosispora sp. WMMD1129 TaxID=3016093 RepID=UPI00249C4608|nr:helix-turn-helix domain-containing protein [Verrucosispora sp. WMMD1129]WFE46354.1 helix-turn-helix domain-containing protein [Verrucosispora sp. WMMD1129]
MTTAQSHKLWTVDDVSAYLGVPVQTLYTWRKRRIGPPAGRVGRHLRYDPDAVRAWFEQQAAA